MFTTMLRSLVCAATFPWYALVNKLHMEYVLSIADNLALKILISRVECCFHSPLVARFTVAVVSDSISTNMS